MYTLGIETSCDETSAAVVSGGRVFSCVTLSSLKFHKKYGGIIPEIASRRHLLVIDIVVKEALLKSRKTVKDIGLVAVTKGPGLVGSLLVGISFAKALAYSLKIPILGVNHLKAHLFASFLNKPKVSLPFIGLVASGGHTQIYLVRDFDNMKLISKTRDDACGEALDKVGRLYGLGFPAGPVIDRLYRQKSVDKRLFKLKPLEDLAFSFSGIKTKASYLHSSLKHKKALTNNKRREILSSFQFTVVDSLINNLTNALRKFKIERVALGGGVIANSLLRSSLKALAKKAALEVFCPSPTYCQDNAACIAGLGEYLYKKDRKSWPDFKPEPRDKNE